MATKKNIEVELRALVSNIDELRNKLNGKRIRFCKEIFLHDIYFCPKNINSLIGVEMNKVGSYSLRLRKNKNKSGKENIYLNTKTITKKGDHNAWEEHETKLDDFREMKEILKQIGFKSFFELKKNRYHYKYKDLNIFLDDIKDFGACIEIEKIVFKGNEDKAKLSIIAFLKTIGVEKSKIVTKSVTNLVMKSRAFK